MVRAGALSCLPGPGRSVLDDEVAGAVGDECGDGDDCGRGEEDVGDERCCLHGLSVHADIYLVAGLYG